MPNNAYVRGVRRERDLVNKYRAEGWDACRSAGSHSPWDVWAFNPTTGIVELTQIKSKKGGKVIKDTVLLDIPARVRTIWRTIEVKQRARK